MWRFFRLKFFPKVLFCHVFPDRKQFVYLEGDRVSSLFTLSICLIVGLMVSRPAKKLGLPTVTAYLVAGIILGPYCNGALGIANLGFASSESISAYSAISQAGLGFIAFAIGNEFRLDQLKQMGRAAVAIGILQAVITTVLVDLVLIGLHFLRPDLISVPAALTLGAIASATAPATTLMVIRQYKADGPMTRLLLLVVAIDDAVGLVLFAISFGVASALTSGSISVVSVVVEPLLEIVLSLVLGAVMGFLLNFLEQFFHSRSRRLTISIACVALTVSLCSWKFTIGGIHCGFSLLLVCMMMSSVFCNICDFSEELLERVDGWTTPMFILFFVLSGAELDFSILKNPEVLLLGVVYIVVRSAGKYFGAFGSAAMCGCEKGTRNYLGITLLPQEGMALGMALTAQALPGAGPLIRSIILFAVLVYELVGPTMTKWALRRSGEIRPEGKTSARRKNLND